MALLAVAVWSTEENGRAKYTKRMLTSLIETVDFNKHQLYICDNGSCAEMQAFYEEFIGVFETKFPKGELALLESDENIGTANAISQAWKYRAKGQNAIKIDDDVVIHQAGWVDEMEEAISRMPDIGIICLKRKDLEERPDHPEEQFRSELINVPHERGQRWITVEKVFHGFGTVQMYNSDFLDKAGFLYQPTKYGFDDSLMATRCKLAGFISCFLSHYNIDHIDTGGDEYTKFKAKHAGETMQLYSQIRDEYIAGTRPIYYTPFQE